MSLLMMGYLTVSTALSLSRLKGEPFWFIKDNKFINKSIKLLICTKQVHSYCFRLRRALKSCC